MLPGIDIVTQDVRYALRCLRRTPGFTVTVLTTLAVGIGASAAVIGTLDNLTRRTPPAVSAPESVKRLQQRFVVPMTRRVTIRRVFSYPEFAAVSQAMPHGVSLAGYAVSRIGLGNDSSGRDVDVTEVIGDYFGTLGVRLTMGRPFAADENARGASSAVAVISDRLWTDTFGRRNDIVGRQIRIASSRFTIVGVAPSDFQGVALSASDVWVPFGALVGDNMTDATPFTNLHDLRFQLILRVVHGSEAGVDQLVSTVLRHAGATPDANASSALAPIGASLDPERDKITGNTLNGLAVAAVIILLLGCANVSNLFVLRAVRRQREIAVRFAIGMSRRRLVAHLVTESMVFAAIAAVVAFFAAVWGGLALRNALVPRIDWGTDSLYGTRVLAITALVALVAGLGAGAFPSVSLWRTHSAGGLRNGSNTATAPQPRIGSTLLVSQAALSFVLLTAAGVLVRSFRNVERSWLGDHSDDVAIAWVAFTPGSPASGLALAAALEQDRARLRLNPYVRQVALAARPPILAASFLQTFLPNRDSLPYTGQTFASVVSPEFFGVMGIHVNRGRTFTDADRVGNPLVAVVNAELAEQYWPEEDPIGKCLIVRNRDAPCRTIVGVVSNSHVAKIIEPTSLQYYLPSAQMIEPMWSPHALLVRSAKGMLSSALPRFRQIVGTDGSAQFHWNVVALSDLLEPEIRPWRLSTLLFGCLGVLAFAVATVGIYGTVAFRVSQRTREIAIRRALGAKGADVAKVVSLPSVVLVGVGICIGGAIVLASGSWLQSLMFNQSPYDPLILVAAAASLGAGALIASAGPIIRSIRVAATVALTTD